MPRAIVELSHAMPDIELIPFAVVGDKWRDEPWWTSGTTLRLLLSEYVKYVAAEVRVRLADARPRPDARACRPAGRLAAAAPAGDGASQLIRIFRWLRFSCVRWSTTCCSISLLVFWIIVALPTFLMPRPAILTVAGWWARSSIWLMRAICNTRVEFRGVEKIPKGPLIVASKHQSMWETFALLQFFDQPLFILKRELTWIPLFGWYLIKANMIGIDRSAGGRSLLNMARRAGEAVRRGRSARHLSGRNAHARRARRRPTRPASPRSMSTCGVSCLPVALNSGLFWPRRTFMRYPGTLVVEFLDPLPPGLSRR